MAKQSAVKTKPASRAEVPFAVPNWPAARVEMWKIGRIKQYEKNPRRHPPEQIEKLARDMLADGVTMPILVDEDGVIIAGHGRVLASIKNGFEEYPVVVARGWSEEQKRSARIRDNQISLLSSWNTELLRGELVQLKSSGFDVGLLGFEGPTLEWMLGGDLVMDPSAEWSGMPGFNHQDKTAFKSVVVHFKDQAAVDKFSKAVKQKIGPATRSLWYPEAEIETYVDKRYAASK